MQGRIKWIDETRGFGVITSRDEEKDVFLYCTPPCEPFREGDELEFEIQDRAKGNEASVIRKL